jgi:hypothetical protein
MMERTQAMVMAIPTVCKHITMMMEMAMVMVMVVEI